MPELPEVESVRTFLADYVNKKQIIFSQIILSSFFKNINAQKLDKLLLNEKILSVKRRGKNLIFCFQNFYLINHLRMSGRWLSIKGKIVSNFDYYWDKVTNFNKKHIVFKIIFSDSTGLIFYDHRHFATFHFFKTQKEVDSFFKTRIGFDLWNDEIDIKLIKKTWSKKKKSIKSSLLEQNLISGIGNLYASEILFLSKIHPLSQTKNLNEKQIKLLLKTTKKIFQKAIKNKGTTIHDFATDKESGNFQQFLLVYQKKNQPCSLCGKLIRVIKISQRSSYFCFFCQKIY